MLRLKSAQIQDFTDVNVRRVFGYAFDALHTQQDAKAIQNLTQIQEKLKESNPYISFQELAATPVWEQLQQILGSNWTLEPHRGLG